jgi:hypothetical protein
MKKYLLGLATFMLAAFVGAGVIYAVPSQTSPYTFSPTKADPAVAQILLQEHQRLLAKIGSSKLETMGWKRRNFCVSCQNEARKKKCSLHAFSVEMGRVACGVANAGCSITGFDDSTCQPR